MRKKIWRMAEDQFDIASPQLKISEETIAVEAVAGDAVRGSFTIESTNGVAFRGVCYSTNPYIRVLTPQFEGVIEEISYETINSGFLDGDEIKGNFYIVTGGAELVIPFHIQYQHRYPSSSVGVIDSDEQFARLAKEHWNEAMQLFYSDRIMPFIETLPMDRQLLYRGFAHGVPSGANLESYLIASSSKEPVIFSIDESDRTYYGLKENQRETVEITRSNWGHIDIAVSSDADFVTVEKERLTAEFFMGSRMQLSVYIHADRLHAGKNFAKITFTSENAEQEICVMATALEEDEDFIPASLVRGRRLIKLTQVYEDYRFEKISSQEWAKESVALLDQLLEDDKDSAGWQLMKAHALIVGGDRQEALWIIQQLRRDIEDRKSTEWAYLLYLCTLIEKEEEYVDRLVREIELIFKENPDDPVIFWFLLFLRQEYIDDYKRRLADISRWMLDGEDSPFFYVEAEYLYRQEPYLLTKFDEFSLRILRWMLRHGQMTGQLAEQISYVLEGERSYRKEVFALIGRTYDAFPSDAFLNNIVTYLLRSHKYGERYLIWYDRAIKAEMNFTGLYEAYVLSFSNDYTGALPQMVVMYFRYQNTLPVEKKAFVYANVILHQKNQLRIYEQYIRHTEEFALDMVRKKRMDDNLAVIYQHIFLERGIVDGDVADCMGDMLFYDKVFGMDSDIVRIIVWQEQLAAPVIAAVEQHKAYVPIYSKNYRIFLEDRHGRLHTDRSEYYVEHLMQPGRAYRKLYELASRRLHYFLYDLNQRSGDEDFLTVDIPDIAEFLSSDEVDERYRKQMYPSLIRYIADHGENEELERHFRSIASPDGLDSETIAYITELHIVEEEYDKAFDLVLSYNGTGVEGKALLKLCTQRIREDGERADDFLIGLSCRLLRRFLSTEETITYLNRFFIGPTADMVMLWQFASARNLETRALEERILTQMLFTEQVDAESEPVYSSYLAHHPNRMLKDAYATYFSQKYMTTKEPVPERIFGDTMLSVRQDEPLNDSMKLALMKHLSEKEALSGDEYEVLDTLLASYVLAGTYFAFFKEFDRRLIVKYHLYDKTFVEYRGEHGRHLAIRCRKNDGDEEVLEMNEMYPGIYVRGFVMFFGDKLKYRITDVLTDGAEEIVVEEELTYTGTLEEAGMSRYERLNAMQNAFLYSNEKQLLADMKEYQGLSYVTDQLFSML